MIRAKYFANEVGKMQGLLRERCGKKITLSFDKDSDLPTVRATNVSRRDKNCVKNTILGNLEGVHIVVQPALWSLANSL